MAGASPAAQMLGLMGQGDITADEAKRKQKEQQAQNPLAKMLDTYGQAARDLLSMAPMGPGTVGDVQNAAAAKKPKPK